MGSLGDFNNESVGDYLWHLADETVQRLRDQVAAEMLLQGYTNEEIQAELIRWVRGPHA